MVARDGFWTVSASQVKRAKHLAQYDAKEFSTFNDEEEEIKEKEREKVEVRTRTRLSQDRKSGVNTVETGYKVACYPIGKYYMRIYLLSDQNLLLWAYWDSDMATL